MQNLSFVGLSDDGAALILTGPDGSRFRLAIDERLRSATRGGRAHMDVSDVPVTARDIQARLRAGATPTEVAEFSGWAVERVEAFAAPILQERGWVAEKAQKCPIGRSEEDPELGELVARRLSERGIDTDSTRWDSWRREDGLWTVAAGLPRRQGRSGGDVVLRHGGGVAHGRGRRGPVVHGGPDPGGDPPPPDPGGRRRHTGRRPTICRREPPGRPGSTGPLPRAGTRTGGTGREPARGGQPAVGRGAVRLSARRSVTGPGHTSATNRGTSISSGVSAPCCPRRDERIESRDGAVSRTRPLAMATTSPIRPATAGSTLP